MKCTLSKICVLVLLCLWMPPEVAWAKAPLKLVVTGKVVGADDHMALPGVNIIIKGTTLGTQTDADGSYSIEVPNEDAILVFSSIGYESQEQSVAGRTVIDVTLGTDLKTLQEIVVVGYGTQDKKDVTGAIGSVNAKELKSLPVPSISDAIQGRAAGVQVMSSGVPGNDATFLIRGSSTMNSNNPLLVIDGVPVASGLNTLNPDDIESVQVLKDASAAAIYGSRGANGVIIVTTKRGKGQGAQFNVNYYTAVQQPTSVVKMLNASQFAALNNEMLANNDQPTNPGYADPSSLGKGTDWLDNLFRSAPMQNFSASFSGSTDKSNYHVSANVLDQQGIVINTGYKRYTVQFNMDNQVLKRLKFGNNLTLNHDVKSSGNYSIKNAMAALPTQSIYNPDGTYSGPQGNPLWYGGTNNPIGQAKLIKNSTNGYNLIGGAYGELEIVDNLRFKSNVGLQANFWDTRSWNPQYDWSPTPQTLSTLSQGYNKNLTWLWDNTLTYTRSFNSVHDVTALVGTSAQHNRYDWISGYRQLFASDVTQQLTNGGQAGMRSDGNASEWALFSYFARVNYSYNDKYLLTATVRRDGSSRFGPNNKYGTFPSVSAAWRISREGFMSNVHQINDLKLRAGYGVTGNQDIGNYSFASVLKSGNYNFNGQFVPTMFPQAMPNPNVHWESVIQSNVGIDASLFNSRINITVDAFLKETKDMLVRGAVPISTGYSDDNSLKPYVNAGKMQNKGIETTISTKNSIGLITWNTSFNMTYLRNKIVSLNDTVPLSAGNIDGNINYFVIRQQNGHPFNSFFGLETNGIFQNQEQVDVAAQQTAGADPYNRTSPGDIRFKDLDNNGRIDNNDRTFIGNPNPKFIFALNNSFAYKGVDLSIFLQGVQGNDIYNANRIWQEGMGAVQNQTTRVLSRWNGEGTSNTMPRAVYNDPNKNAGNSNRFVEDGSYLRIKNITLGYTLPKSLIEKLRFSSVRIYASAQNLYTFTKYTGFDPEVGFTGIDFNVYPVTRTVSAGINLGF